MAVLERLCERERERERERSRFEAAYVTQAHVRQVRSLHVCISLQLSIEEDEHLSLLPGTLGSVVYNAQAVLCG